MGIQDNEKKFVELILYISQRSAHDLYFGATKLNKILYLSDFRAYGLWGSSITGAEYQHLQQGPAPRRLKPVRSAMEADEVLAIQPVLFSNGKTQHRTVNLREPDLSLFEAREIALVDSVIDELRNLNATEASNLTHQFVGWLMTEEGQTIDYATIFLSAEQLTLAEAKRARELEGKYSHLVKDTSRPDANDPAGRRSTATTGEA
ncbi:MAG: Panacea domain-containing protein [Acidobacteriaceae bacterium]